MAPVFKSSSKNFFSLPNELFFLNLGHGAITVYAYLLYCEDHRTHQCHPSYRTIAAAVHFTVSTMIKHITKLEDRQIIAVESTSYLDSNGMKWNGSNQYTVLPIQVARDHCYQQQMHHLDQQRKWQRVQNRTRETPCAPRCEELCAAFGGWPNESTLGIMRDLSGFSGQREANEREAEVRAVSGFLHRGQTDRQNTRWTL